MRPQTPSRKSSRSTPAITNAQKRRGLKSKKVPSDEDIGVEGYVDKNGGKWVGVTKGKDTAIARLDDLIGNPATFFRALAAQDVVVTSSSTTRVIEQKTEEIEYLNEVYVLDHFGRHGFRYVRPGGPIPKRIAGMPVAVDLPTKIQAPWATAGSLKGWKLEVRRLANGQDLPTFALAAAFEPLIAALFPRSDNIFIEVVGPTSDGKSSLFPFLATVYGSPAFVRTWATTVDGLELTMAAYNDALLLLDELNYLLSREKGLQQLSAVTFQLAGGNEKARFTDTAAPREFRFLAMSSTNLSILELLSDVVKPDLLDANRVRLLSIPANAGTGHGIFNTLPKGCASGADAVEALTNLAGSHYGWAARKFIKRLQKALSDKTDREALIAQLSKWRQEFKERTGVSGDDGPASRVVDKFALIYAAGMLARRWKILPVKYVRRSVLAIYHRFLAYQQATGVSPSRSAHDEVLAYVESHRAEIYDLQRDGYPDLNEDELDRAAGFLIRDGNVTWFAIRARKWREIFGLRGKHMLEELRRNNLLWRLKGKAASAKFARKRRRTVCIASASMQDAVPADLYQRPSSN